MSCTIAQVGVTGDAKQVSGMCILNQNIINEKIFLALWFWYIFLFAVCGCVVMYNITTIVMPQLRTCMISHHSQNKHYDGSLTNFLNNECDIGDWFLLNQIGKNVDKYFYEKFVNELFAQSNKKARKKETPPHDNEDYGESMV